MGFLEEKLKEQENKKKEEEIKKENNLNLIAEQEHKISELLLNNSILMSEIQKKSEMIKSLNEKIAILNESDKILLKNKELEKENNKLIKNSKQTKAEAETMIEVVKNEYLLKSNLLSEQQEELKFKIKEIDEKKANIEEDIKKQANEIIKSKEKTLENKDVRTTINYYSYIRHYSYVTGVTLYSIFLILLISIRSKVFISDFISFFRPLWYVICFIVRILLKSINFVSSIADKIQQETVAMIVHSLLFSLVFIIYTIIIISLLIFLIQKIADNYNDDYTDNITLVFVLISLSSFVFFASEIKMFININIMFAYIIIFLLFFLIRFLKNRYF